MALSALEQDTITKGMILSEKIRLIHDEIRELNVIFDGSGGVKDALSPGGTPRNAEVQAIWPELTVTIINDGYYLMTATLKTALDAAYTQLVGLAKYS